MSCMGDKPDAVRYMLRGHSKPPTQAAMIFYIRAVTWSEV